MADALTISLLPVPLALVHIPRTRLPALSHPVLRHILHPSPTFFTVTANEIEISLFVDWEHVHDFDVIARKDLRSMRDDPVEISYEPWSVLQVDSHSDQLDNSGARVNELSGPLAVAGISILYQSSYMCDFIFVKESRLHEALTLFEMAGFDLYTSNMTSSPAPTYHPTSSHSSTTASSPTILTLSHASTLTHTSSTPTSCSITPIGRHSSIHHLNERTKSHSPTSGEVRILDPDLACVGLSDELGVDHWGLKIVKLVAFPELIPSSRKRSKSSTLSSCSSSFGEDEGDDGYFSHSPHSVSTSSLNVPPVVGPNGSLSSRRSSVSSGPAGPSRSRTGSGQGLPLITTSELVGSPSLAKSSSSPASPIASSNSSSIVSSPNIPQLPSPISRRQASPSSSPPLSVPFFSFTRTQEGSSLTADVKTLAALFPPEERHLLVCCTSLDFGSPSSESDEDEDLDDDFAHGMDDLHLDELHDIDVDDMSIGELKCLQIDLRRFGLDKYGLVNKFSRVLGENGVNHMYSSTFKTANLLVNKKHARRAQALLRGC
ncbi:hypothetical protein NP233_g5388 [Leucocoprinus birnbaumii]|uniref:CASTOR ACT domain-containing protein n=1 Tax=Leucocoprinus birnbaumii TaxID=56174 RepID=A0AAD5VSY7_9AGAR|nr:hypothetical protein NP233_g5388 [Leucocoprinus birnbaumii]